MIIIIRIRIVGRRRGRIIKRATTRIEEYEEDE